MHSESTALISLRARDGSVRAYAVIDEADLEWASQYCWHFNPKGYAERCVHVAGSGRHGKTKTYLLHRELIGAKSGQIVDHINRNRLDDRRENLRFVGRGGNAINSKFRANNTSGFRGVSYQRTYIGLDKWIAYIGANRKKKTIGRYATAEEAAVAYDAAARFYHGKYAQLNFP